MTFFALIFVAPAIWKEDLDSIEIPGFEPVLFITVFGILAIITILRYHFKHERTQ